MEPKLPAGSDPESIVLRFKVPREQAGLRLDHFLVWCIPRLSRAKAQRVIANCAKWPDGSPRKGSDRVRAGETVLIIRPPMNEPDTPQTFDIVYEDEDVLAVSKPAGLPIHPSATYHKNTLHYLLQQRFPTTRPMYAHRLDKETSGIVVCGKVVAGRGSAAEKALKHAFEKRRVKKTYLAIVRGRMQAPSGQIETGLARALNGPHVAMEVSDRPEAKHAHTEYEVLSAQDAASLVILHPRTGRQHQLRVHLSYIGHPIIGDKLYGPTGFAPFLEFVETGMTPAVAKVAGGWRHMLHAAKLELAHPRTQDPLVIHAPSPTDFVQTWRALALDTVSAGAIPGHDL